MRIAAIKVCQESGFKSYKAYQASPPQGIFSLAAATPKPHQVTILDETIGDALPEEHQFDLLVLFASTPDISRAYSLADSQRALGVPVVLAGLHVSALPEEAQLHADAVMVGEAEQAWPQLLADLAQGALKPRNQGQGSLDLATLNPWPMDARLSKRYGCWGVLVGRGCRHSCSYCTVRPFFKREAFRPVDQVVAEIRASGCQSLELHCDNLCADRDYALSLFRALTPLNIHWVGEATLDFVEDEELLAAAVASGLWYLLIGLETVSQEALKGAGKNFIKVDRAKALIERLHSYNVIVDSCLLFGFDQHDGGIFERTLAFVDEIKLDVPQPNILTPFPGTKLYNQLDRQGRLLTRDWQRYDCSQGVFQPAQMSVQELEQGVAWLNDELWSAKRTLGRFGRVVSMQGFSVATSLFL
ncbi:B12-binding domain-containing radical SAM protein [Ferrimonas futtsuensis]|uniref:B12-binding domain-containing radical SAM protein n=1 Tax=Ferrimonas futtsuensis TaxID=364764 RepID=UPI0004033D86|nr:B12-binding domain-containing radical SAM protein [Ferrimonas futtsuensis]